MSEATAEKECTHPMLSLDHGEHGHYCGDCGGEEPFPEECYECALEETCERLRRAERDRYYLLKHLRRWHTHDARADSCTTCQLVATIEK